jgi:hypothetical protein
MEMLAIQRPIVCPDLPIATTNIISNCYSSLLLKADSPEGNLLSSAGLITLASSLPSLKKLILPNSPGTSDEAFLHLLASFPALTHIEINGVSSITSASFEALQTQSNLLPNLKSLTLSFPRYAENEKVFEKAMRAMGRVRTKLVVGFKNNHEEKNFQDWDLVWDITKYKNGRKMKESMKDYGMNDAAGMYGDDGGYGGGFGRYMYSY